MPINRFLMHKLIYFVPSLNSVATGKQEVKIEVLDKTWILFVFSLSLSYLCTVEYM